MPLTFVHAAAMSNAEWPPGDAYADHEVAMAYSPTTRFGGGTPTSTGVFPDMPVAGIPGTDKLHVHAITLGGVVWRVSVTFLLEGEHIGNAFYFPVPARSKTYSRFCTRLPKFSTPARDLADTTFEDFFNACPKLPGKTANEQLLDAINSIVASRKLAEEQEKERIKAAATVKVVVQPIKQYDSLFGGQGSSASGLSHEDALKRIADYVERSKVKLDAGESKAILVALKEGRPKEKWTGFVQKYYDGVMA